MATILTQNVLRGEHGNLKVANKKTNLALEKFRKSETIKEMLGLNFQTITLAHSHEKLSHSFPANNNINKISITASI